MTYQFIADAQSEYPVSRLWSILGVSVSGYSAWKQCPQSLHAREDGHLKHASAQAYTASKERYGSPRVHAELRDHGYRCSRKRVARLMREEGFCARNKCRRIHTTRQDPSHQKAENILDQQFEATAPNQKWGADVTVFRTQEGPLFLAGVLDLFSRSLVGWALAPVQDRSVVWSWPRKMHSPNLEINSSVIDESVQTPSDSHTGRSSVDGWGYKSTPDTQKWLNEPLAYSGSARD